MRRSYTEYASKMQEYLNTKKNDDAVKKFETAANSSISENQLSNIGEYGRQRKITQQQEKLEGLSREISAPARDLLKLFCDDYALSFYEDSANHAADISNALQVIEMCGINLSTDLLASVTEPLQGSFSSLKLIYNVLIARRNNQASEGYSPEVQRVLRDWESFDIEIADYSQQLNALRAMIDYPTLTDFRLNCKEENDLLKFSVIDRTKFSVFCIPDAMIKIGEMRDSLDEKYPHMLKN